MWQPRPARLRAQTGGRGYAGPHAADPLRRPGGGLPEEAGAARGRPAGTGRTQGALLEEEASRLAAGPAPVTAEFPGRSPEELRLLAAKIAARGRLAILAATMGDQARLALARPAGEGPDLASALRRILPLMEGKGGGTAVFAQGGGRADRLGEALAALRKDLR